MVNYDPEMLSSFLGDGSAPPRPPPRPNAGATEGEKKTPKKGKRGKPPADPFAVGGEGSERLAFYDCNTGALTASLALGADATAVARVDAATVAVATEACDGVALHAVSA